MGQKGWRDIHIHIHIHTYIQWRIQGVIKGVIPLPEALRGDNTPHLKRERQLNIMRRISKKY